MAVLEIFLRGLLSTRGRRGTRRSLKWVLVWTAIAVLAGPAIGKIIEEQGK